MYTYTYNVLYGLKTDNFLSNQVTISNYTAWLLVQNLVFEFCTELIKKIYSRGENMCSFNVFSFWVFPPKPHFKFLHIKRAYNF